MKKIKLLVMTLVCSLYFTSDILANKAVSVESESEQMFVDCVGRALEFAMLVYDETGDGFAAGEAYDFYWIACVNS